jgi:hypothetical protein
LQFFQMRRISCNGSLLNEPKSEATKNMIFLGLRLRLVLPLPEGEIEGVGVNTRGPALPASKKVLVGSACHTWALMIMS